MAKLPPRQRRMSAIVREQGEEQKRARSSSAFFGTGIHPNGDGGMDLDGTLNVDGEIVARSGVVRSGNFKAGTAGWRANADGDLEVNDITLRGGIIGNDALTTPVIPAVVNTIGTGFGLIAAAWSTVSTQTVTVPAGVTQLLAHASGMCFAVNPNNTGGSNGTGGDFIQARVCIGSVNGLTAGVAVTGSNGQTSVSCSVAALLSDLTPGSTFTITTQAASGIQNFSANGANQANTSATLLWLR